MGLFNASVTSLLWHQHSHKSNQALSDDLKSCLPSLHLHRHAHLVIRHLHPRGLAFTPVWAAGHSCIESLRVVWHMI
eukprot:6180648-Pleurochrysis_carterae.AAC.1